LGAATLDRAKALAARFVPPPVVTAARSIPPAHLSDREMEVLRLLAAGRTNREIAVTLFISVHTVNAHVKTILGKTGSANRVEAAAFAHAHHLI
jgi:DNA-binding CsgD family transcriptional regulator